LDDPNLVIWSLSIVLIWQFVGQYVIIIMTGLQNVDPSLLEAAQIDGASNFQSIKYITLPLMKPTLFVCVTLCISGCMKLFDTIYALTGGGPGRSSTVTALYAYDVAFKLKDLGYASAVSMGMIILSLLLIIIAKRIMSRKEDI
ncbi:ABC transporter permease subunit, partial [Parabacteroides distasonis]